MILFLVGSKQSVSVASKTSEAESVGTAEVKTSARLSTEAEKKIIGLASSSWLLLVTSKPGGGACPRSAEAKQGVHSAAAHWGQAQGTSVATLVETSCKNMSL